jgi:hypothetical protein
MRCVRPIALTLLLGACSSQAIRCDDHLDAINAPLPPQPPQAAAAPATAPAKVPGGEAP